MNARRVIIGLAVAATLASAAVNAENIVITSGEMESPPRYAVVPPDSAHSVGAALLGGRT